MKVLFAVGNASLSEKIASQYFSTYGEKIEYKDVFYFKAILEEVKRDKSYDRIVIAEQLEPMQNNVIDEIDKMLFNNIDSITDEIEDSTIIFICSDNRTRNDALIGRFFNLGIYNVMIGDERQPSYLCKLLKDPRSKKEAKEYLKSNPAVGETSIQQDDGVNEAELMNICRYFDELRTPEEYLKAFASVKEQYEDKDLIVIVAALTKQLRRGKDIFATLQSDSRYSMYCEWGNNLNNAPANEPKQEKKGILSFIKGKKGGTNNSKELQQVVDRRRAEQEEEENPIRDYNGTMGDAFSGAVGAITQGFNNDNALQNQLDAQRDAQNRFDEENRKKQEQLELMRQREEEIRRQEELLVKQQEELLKQQEEEKRLRDEKFRVQQEAYMKAQQEEALKKQQEEMLRAQQEELLRAQQEQILKVQQEEAMKAQQEEVLKAQQEEALKAQQEEMLRAQQEEMLKRQQEEILRQQQEEALKRQQEEAFKTQQEEMLKAQQEEMLKRQQDEILRQQQEDQIKAQQEAARKQQEEALRKQQEEQIRAQQDAFQRQQQELLRQQEELRRQREELNKQYSAPYGGGISNTSTSSYDSSSNNSDDDYVDTVGPVMQVPNDYKKVVAFVGTNKVGTTFMANCVGTLLATKGVKTSILDMTKNRGLFWFYEEDTKRRLDDVAVCMSNLSSGVSNPVQIGRSRNLTLYTTIPKGKEDNRKGYRHRNVVDTAKRSCNLLIIDCDFTTPVEYFEQAQEIYVVQDYDLIKVVETKEFFRELKARRTDWTKLRVIFNNTIPSMKITSKRIINDALTFYQDTSETYTEEFDKIKRYIEFPMEQQNYINYIESIGRGRLDISKFTPSFVQSLETLSTMVYGIPSGHKKRGLF